jgi:hypothetical protein
MQLDPGDAHQLIPWGYGHRDKQIICLFICMPGSMGRDKNQVDLCEQAHFVSLDAVRSDETME